MKKFSEWLNENYKSLGLYDPKEYSPGITYVVSERMEKINRTDHNMEPEEIIDFIVHETGLDNGEIYVSEDEFLLSGIVKSGKNLYIEQTGEFDKYGGPYDPPFDKPKILIDGKDRSDFIIDEIREPGGGEGNYPDVSQILNEWAYLINKPDSFFTGKKYGLS